ncbi:MAG: stress response translation initiation inhibitor YciH [Methylococcales bacterium]
MAGNSRLVYSTETGRIKEPKAKTKPLTPEGDGIVRIRRETKGRKGKGVTTVSGLALGQDELESLATRLKKVCGCGGSVKQGVIEIQGDQREIVKAELEKQGHTAKLAGG